MSTLSVDTITGKSTSTNLTIGSTPVVSASANSLTIRGEGSAQTSIQQGLAKGWISFDGVGTSVAEDTFNSSLVTDHGTGDYTLGITNNMASVNYIVTCESGLDNVSINLGAWMHGVVCNSDSGSVPVTKTTSQVRTKTGDTGGTQRDIENGGAVFHGDLA
tara:strand:+ start:549 stop:1031 length:483 start_codon:yes stop_codon:yes gene_type:complete